MPHDSSVPLDVDCSRKDSRRIQRSSSRETQLRRCVATQSHDAPPKSSSQCILDHPEPYQMERAFLSLSDEDFDELSRFVLTKLGCNFEIVYMVREVDRMRFNRSRRWVFLITRYLMPLNLLHTSTLHWIAFLACRLLAIESIGLFQKDIYILRALR